MKLVLGLVVLAAVAAGMLFLIGMFDTDKVGPGTKVAEPEKPEAARLVPVEEKTLPVTSEAVGTVRSRRTTRVSPRIMGTILEITVVRGDRVEKGRLLARLDDREVQARYEAARARLQEALARSVQATAAYRRYTELLKKRAATREQVEAVTADYEAAKAGVTGAREAVRAAEIVVKYTEIHAPLSGVVAEKLAEPGDLALPGRPILILHDPADLRLEADVREYLIPYLSVGAKVTVVFGPPLNEVFASKVEERAPMADPVTRTFRVKAPIPRSSKARPGNFGRLRFVTGKRKVLLLPAAAIRRIGQLETVRVVEEGRIEVRHIKTGEKVGDRREILSGLSAGERVAVGR